MTARRVVAGLKTYLSGAGLTLTGLSYATVEESEDKAYPLITIDETGTEEHEVLQGVYSITVDCSLHTDPEKTTDAAHNTAQDEFYAALGDTSAVKTALDGETLLTCWDVRGVNQSNAPEDGRRKTTVSLTITAAEI
jgi:hypothetical protein